MKMIAEGDLDSSSTSESEDEDGEVSYFDSPCNINLGLIKTLFHIGLGFWSRETVFSNLGIIEEKRS